MTEFKDLGIAVPDILFPADNTDLSRWATIACDQFTSQPEYWDEVKRIAGDAPSTLNMQMPEAWLEKDPAECQDSKTEEHRRHEEAIPGFMNKYMEDGTLQELPEGFIFIKRQTSAGIRRGLLALFDLERYEYTPGNRALIRATEKTVESRLPVRVTIRKNAPLEMPHAMILVNDPKDTLMGTLEFLTRNREPLYDFDLMQGSGNIKGFLLQKKEEWQLVAERLSDLKKDAPDGMLFAVGDGNHSLAAAKLCWEEEKKEKAQPDIRKRYVLAELVNLYDHALLFKTIHRLVKDGQIVDYIHGEAECLQLARKLGCTAQIMPPYPKDRLFADVIEKGVLPQKTFSMGDGPDKRFYLECRKL